MLPLPAALLFLALAAPASAIDHDSGSWLIATASDRFPSADGSAPSRWRYWLEVQARYPDVGSGDNQLLLRPGLGYVVNPDVSVYFGYARFRTHAARTTTEDRLWQHLNWRFMRWGDASLSMRFRLEQRDLSTGDDIGHVLRYRLRYDRKVAPDSDMNLIASIEPFFDLRDTDYGARQGLNQVRLYLGVSWPLTAKSGLEAGYQNQFVNVRGGEDRMNHLAMLTFRTRF